MSRIADGLLKSATEIAAQHQSRAHAFEAELLEIERRKIEIGAKLKAAHLAPQRALNFKPMLGPDYQCPACWIDHDARSTLFSVPATATDDIMRCPTCDADFLFPFNR